MLCLVFNLIQQLKYYHIIIVADMLEHSALSWLGEGS